MPEPGFPPTDDSTLMTGPPRTTYENRRNARRQQTAHLQRSSDRLSLWRGLVFLAGVVLLAVGGSHGSAAVWMVVVAAAVFVVLVIRHAWISRQLDRSRAAVAFYELGLRRLDDDWAGQGPPGNRYRNPQHLYADDLDLFGNGSLFQLLCRARTRLGEDRLAEWLLQPADAATIDGRQAAVRELRQQLDLQEELALLPAEVHDGLNQNLLWEWSRQKPEPFSGGVRCTAAVLSLLMVAGLVGWLFFQQRLAWMLAAASLMAVFQFRQGHRIRRLAETADAAESGLRILAQVLELLERQQFEQPVLRQMQQQLTTDGHPPSHHIRRLERLIHALNNSLRNQFFAAFGFVLALPLHLAHAVECWRSKTGRQIAGWLNAVAEFEALMSLAGYTFENPEAVFPELAEEVPLFHAEELGHPLLPRQNCIRNDVRLDETCRLILVSGSNMSGKSTLLRAVGVNTVLALAGAPVRARRLRLCRLQPATSMRIQDSLRDGKSLFFSALQRIKAIVEATRGSAFPVLFLLDEILQGTNSHDRRRGAEGVVKTLLQQGAVGLVTTHDLALTHIVDQLDGMAANAHFQDEMNRGVMTFDYRLRPGVVEKSNALELMRSLGLDVPSSADDENSGDSKAKQQQG